MNTRDVDASVKTLNDFCDEFGPLDAMVNNVGITKTWNFLDVTQEQFNLLSEVNIRGTYFMMQAAAKIMIAAGKKGAIINLSSVHAIGTFVGHSTYATTRAAVVRMTRSVALELAPYGINVNAFAPGYVDMSTSDIYADPKTQEDLKKGMAEAAKYYAACRWQKPEEIASARIPRL